MDDIDQDQSNYRTPMLTPHTSEVNTSQEYPDSEVPFSSGGHQQAMNDLSSDLEQINISFNYQSSNNNCESEYESDILDERPTEATDDSNDPNPSPNDPVEITIDKSLHPQPSQERDDIRSPEQDTEPSEEIFSSVMPDMDNNYETKPTEPLSLVYKESLCVPYTDEQDEIAMIKQTTTTTTITTEYTEPKKDKNNIGHIMISYNRSTKLSCLRIAEALKSLNYNVWIDEEDISGDVFASMAFAVENAYVVLMAINEQYYQSSYCQLEAEYSMERNKTCIPMLMQSGFKASGWLGIIKGSKLHIDFTKGAFEEAFKKLRREIDNVRLSLEADGNDRTNISPYFNNNHSITTINNSWDHFQNVNEWNADDVIDWLNREKLDIFQNSLTNFTGTTLWQLYKIKFDSAPDYYRTVESLLPSTIPLRLFYNLTFNAALESLFSSSNPISQRL